MESKDELNLILRGLLISNPKVTKASILQAEFLEIEGKHFPYRQLGFLSFLDYLRSIPSVVTLVPFGSENPDVLPVATKASSHIDKLVLKQLSKAPKKSSSTFYSIRGGYNGRPRRRPPCGIPDHYKLSHQESPDVSYSGTIDDYNLIRSEKDFGDFELDFNNEDIWESESEELLSNCTIKHNFDSTFDSQKHQIERYDETQQEPEIYCSISDAMIRNFKTILEKHPHGIGATDVPQLHKSDISSVFVPENVLKPNQIIGFEELPQPKKDRAANEPLFEIEVRLGEVISPSMFFIMLDSKYNDLQIMMDDLDKFYKLEQDLFRIPLSAITLNLICACEYEGSWHRAKVTAFKSNNTIEIEYIDYGTPATVKQSDLRYLQNEFAKLPAQAIYAKLIGIQPVDGKKWPKEVCAEFLHLVSDRRLFAEVFNISYSASRGRMQLEIILHDTLRTDAFNFNDYFVLVRKSAMFGYDDNKSFVPSENTDYAGTSSQCSYPTNIPSYTTTPFSGYNTQASHNISNHTNNPFSGYDTQASHNISNHTNNPFSGNNTQPPHMQINNFPSSFYVTPQMFGGQNIPYINQNSLYNMLNPALPSIPPSPISPHSSLMFPYEANISHKNVNISSKEPNVISQPLVNPILEGNYNRLNSGNKIQFDYCEKSHIPVNFPGSNNGLPLPQALSQQEMSNTFFQPLPQQRYNSGLPLSQTLPQQGLHSGLPLPLLPQQGFTTDLGLPLSQPLTTQHNVNNLCPPVSHSSLSKQNAITVSAHKNRPQSSPVILPIQDEIHAKRPLTPQSSLSAEISNFSIDDDSEKCDNKNQEIELKEISVKSSSLVEVENSWNDIQGVNSGRSHVQEIKESCVNSVTQNKKLSKPNQFHNPVNLEVSNDLKQKDVHSADTSSKLKYCKVKKSEPLNLLSEKAHVDIDNENISGSWEDILSDDIPAKADNFVEDFKKPLDLIFSEKCKIQLKSTIQHDNSMFNNIVENNLLFTKPNMTPINWKDVFVPDSISITRFNRNIKNEMCSRIDKERMKKNLVQKIDIDNKFFHLILVKNKLAIICKEFFHQYTNVYFHVIHKLVELKEKPFPFVKKTEEPELFSKLAQVDFCGGMEKGDIFRLNKISIAYLSDVPEVLRILKINNEVLLEELKKISKHFGC